LPNAAFDDRFGHWPTWAARLLLLGLLVLMAVAGLSGSEAPARSGGLEGPVNPAPSSASAKPSRDPDLALYNRVIERVGRGENYYTVVAHEHRQAGFPLRPGVSVRLPTLALLQAQLGPAGQRMAALALVSAVIWAWWKRLGTEIGGPRYRAIGAALALVGVSLILNFRYLTLHELWAGTLISLSLALHRPGASWLAAWLAAALALAIREHALAYVFLMGALALWRRDWREGVAWGALAVTFAIGLAAHLHLVAQVIVPGDAVGPGWLAMRGIDGWISNVVLSGSLDLVPRMLAGPLVILMVFGWLGWKSGVGLAATLLSLGYGLAFMIAGRDNNFYWGALVAPVTTIGLAFAPRALASAWRTALRSGQSA
jgi:hypothetical protein